MQAFAKKKDDVGCPCHFLPMVAPILVTTTKLFSPNQVGEG
jgi:hypothetical protein